MIQKINDILKQIESLESTVESKYKYKEDGVADIFNPINRHLGRTRGSLMQAKYSLEDAKHHLVKLKKM